MKKNIPPVADDVPISGILDLGVENLILEVNGIHVLLDRDLARLYDVETKALNQAVKRNPERFPERFCFRLDEKTQKELVTNCDRFKNLRHSSTCSYVFTEQGVAMLSSVLRSNRAIQVNIAIMDAFVAMRKHFSVNGLLNERFDFIERKQVILEQETSRRFALVFEALDEIKVDPNLLKHQLILNGRKLDADVAYTQIYGFAWESIFVFDDYVGVKTLDLLRGIARNVKVTIFSDERGGCVLTPAMIADFKAARPDVSLVRKRAGNKFHDRYIVLDYGTEREKMFHCGASSKDAGGRVTSINRIEHPEAYHPLMEEVLLGEFVGL